MNSNSVRILVKEKENKEREYVVSKKDAELSELLPFLFRELLQNGPSDNELRFKEKQ